MSAESVVSVTNHACINRGICGKNARRLAEPMTTVLSQFFGKRVDDQFLHFELLFRHVRYSLYGAPARLHLCAGDTLNYPIMGESTSFADSSHRCPCVYKKPHEGDSLLRRRNIDYKASHAISLVASMVRYGRDDLSRNRQTEARPRPGAWRAHRLRDRTFRKCV